MPRTVLALLAVTAVLPIAGATAQTHQPGCDITTSSYVVIDPPSRRKTGPIVAMPQTPCATIPNGYEDVLQGITVDVNRGDLGSDTSQMPQTLQTPRMPRAPQTRRSQR